MSIVVSNLEVSIDAPIHATDQGDCRIPLGADKTADVSCGPTDEPPLSDNQAASVQDQGDES